MCQFFDEEFLGESCQFLCHFPSEGFLGEACQFHDEVCELILDKRILGEMCEFLGEKSFYEVLVGMECMDRVCMENMVCNMAGEDMP